MEINYNKTASIYSVICMFQFNDGLTASRICQLMYEFSGHSVMSWLLRTASFSKENKSSSPRVCEQTFLPNSISLTKALRRPNYWPEKGCTGQTSTKTLNI